MYIVKNLKTILLLKCSLGVVLILVVIWVLFISCSVMPVWLLYSVSSGSPVQFPSGSSHYSEKLKL